MAEGRNKGLIGISGNFEPQIAAPFDARTTVDTVARLSQTNTWLANDNNSYTYEGMTVTVYGDTEENNGVYFLKSLPATDINNWVKIGESSGTTDHNVLTNRELDNQHPISAITGLETELATYAEHITNINNPHNVVSSQLYATYDPVFQGTFPEPTAYTSLLNTTYTALNTNVINPWRGWYTDVERNTGSWFYDGPDITWSNRNNSTVLNGFKTDPYFAFNYPINRFAGSSLVLFQLGLAEDCRAGDDVYTPTTVALTDDQMNDLRTALQTARNNGVGIIIRAEQDLFGVSTPSGITDTNFNSSTIRAEAPDYNLIKTHAEQIAQLASEFEDVVISIQIGFFGPWGEFHSSRWSETEEGSKLWAAVSAGPQRFAYNAMYNILKNKDVYILMRRPQYIRNVTDPLIVSEVETDNTYGYNREGYLGPIDTLNATVSAEQAYTISPLAKTGLFHDSLYGGDANDITDAETWTDPREGYATDAERREGELGFMSNQALYTPVMGESYNTTTNSVYSDSVNAFEDNRKMRMMSINQGLADAGGALEKWKTSTAFCIGSFAHLESDYEYASMMQGYRFVLNSASVGFSSVEYGGSIKVNFNISNKGWGNLLKKSTVNLVLRNGTRKYTATTNVDPRFWNPTLPSISHELYFKLPSDIPLGNWDAYLQINGGFTTTQDNKWFSVLFSNENMWIDDKQDLYRSSMNKLGSINITGVGSEQYLRQINSAGFGIFKGINWIEDSIDPIPPVGKVPLITIESGTSLGGKTLSFDPAIIEEFNSDSGYNGGWTINPYNNDAVNYIFYIDSDDKQFAIVKDSDWSSQINFITTNFADFTIPANTTLLSQFESWTGTVPQTLLSKIYVSDT